MKLNPDPNKQANGIIFCRKLVSNKLSHPPKFNNYNINRCSDLKPSGVALDSNLNFNIHIDQKIKSAMK